MFTFTMPIRRLHNPLKLGVCFPSRQRHVRRMSIIRSFLSLTCSPKPKNDPVAEFFARFPDFKYNPNTAWPGEWKRLREELEEQLQRAAIERFHSTYSYDPSDLAAWHKMCRVVGIVPPQTLKGCREAIKALYINIIDLEHEGHRGNVGTVKQFPSEVALSEYTLRTEKIFLRRRKRARVPKRSLLKLLLRNIFNPQLEKVGKIARATTGRNLHGKQNDVESRQLEKRRG